MPASLGDVSGTDWQRQVLESPQPVLVEFWHDACIWCKRLEPILVEIAPEYAGTLRFARLNVLASQENNHLGHQYGVMGTPTLILFCNGRPIHHIVGFRPKEKLRQELADVVKNYEACFQQSTPLKS
jgi:thioredoxin 1